MFGGTNDTTKAQWSLLERFPQSDIIAFTTYPGLIYKNPSEIPADYYTEIKSHTTKPVAFTEIGWHSEASPTGWESSDAEQAEFVRTFFDRTKNLDKELTIWSFMYDQNIIEPFSSMGLRRRSDGTSKPAWDDWVAVLSSVESEGQDVPGNFLLYQNYPNPFNSKTTIKFALPQAERVTLKIYDLLGREVATLLNESLMPGLHSIELDASCIASGIFFYQLTAGNFTQINKLLYIK